jgi:hypothetical protein
MTTSEVIELHKKIMEGLILAAQKLLEEKRKTNSMMAVYHDDKIQVINARDINW